MLLEIDNFEQFKIFFDIIYDITEFVELQLFRDHMICNILDKGHTRFMSAKYNREFFSVYEVDDAESVILHTDDLHKIIKSASKIDTVILQTNENYLVCKIESNNGNSRVFEFVLPSEYVESPQPPSIDLPVELDLKIDDLKQAIKDLKILGTDELEFSISNQLLSITAGTEITTNYVYNIPSDIEVDYPFSSRFSLDYIDQLLKFSTISKTGKIEIGDDYPLLWSFEDDIMGVEVKGLIAPRIEVED